MAKNQLSTRISPEGLEIANAYLELGSIPAVSIRLRVDEGKISEFLAKREVKQYVDQVYLDSGYRNRFKLAEVLDTIIDKKLDEAEESEVYTNKDIADLVALSHKIRMDEMKAQTELEKAQAANIKNQTNVQINSAEMPFGQGNYGELMKKLLLFYLFPLIGLAQVSTSPSTIEINQQITIILPAETYDQQIIKIKLKTQRSGKKIKIHFYLA